MRWFKFHADLINDPTLQRLPGDKFKTWINLLCITSKHDGVLPQLSDLAFLLRPLAEDKIAALLEEFCEKGLLDSVDVPGASTTYAPPDWASRQYVDATAAERAKRYRDRKLGVTRDGLNGTVTVTALDQKQNKRTEQTGVTGLIEVTDEQALRAWDAYGCATAGKPYPRNRRGGWRFPSLWPPGHGAEVVHVLTEARR
jgi:hypothetical protein